MPSFVWGRKGEVRGGGGAISLGALRERALENSEVFCFLYFYSSKKKNNNNEIVRFQLELQLEVQLEVPLTRSPTRSLTRSPTLTKYFAFCIFIVVKKKK